MEFLIKVWIWVFIFIIPIGAIIVGWKESGSPKGGRY